MEPTPEKKLKDAIKRDRKLREQATHALRSLDALRFRMCTDEGVKAADYARLAAVSEVAIVGSLRSHGERYPAEARRARRDVLTF